MNELTVWYSNLFSMLIYIQYSNMNWFNQNVLYSIPDEICWFADCYLNSSVIQCLNKHYSHDNFKHIPNTLTTLITTYTNEFFGCINEFERTYRKLKKELKSNIYSFLIVEGVECIYEAYDKEDNNCLYELLLPRAKHELCHIDNDGEAFENSCHDDIMEHIRYSQISCNCFKNLFIFFLKQLQNLFSYFIILYKGLLWI